jgi:gamma-glutamyltranspeptidase
VLPEYKESEFIKYPALAGSILKRIAANGNEFYKGETAKNW